MVMAQALISLACLAYLPDAAAASSHASDDPPAGDVVVVHKKKPEVFLYSFYWHDMVGTKNATAIPAISYGGGGGAANNNNNATSNSNNNNNNNNGTTTTSDNNNGIGAFGSVFVFDDPLTVGPSLSSPVFGRAQGMFVANSLSGDNVMVLCTIIINDAFHRGTINLQGADGYRLPEREIPVVGGTEDFRYKSGYAQFKTAAATSSSSANCSVLYVRLHLYHQGPN